MAVENMRRAVRKGALGAAMLAFSAVPAQAALLNPGGTLFPAPAEANPAPGSVMLFSIPGQPFVATPAVFSGTLTSEVWTNDSSNPYGLNAMTFTYRITSDATSINNIVRLTVGGYTGFLTDGSYQDNAGLAPALIDRPTNAFVGFSFQGPPVGTGTLPPGASTAVLVMQTNAIAYQTALANVIDGGQANNVPSLGPAIPEPASLGLIGLAGGLLMRRRSRQE